ncbi:hypothetical protein FD13_GL000374 [Levilactobacillus senmaizukei DSM 21775 = NBRC 103853]|uniref:ABC transporter permease n=1 Tax=Levilactobacillus senmaizukei DSM 21775 = NBRC 103853 TaxID=1423803 RepID=A0A0R2DQC0_9LACO|nr:ABC transporter permease [Levilactobacillus senmaizukei]KRN02068.1 hypothetical protein FD13_GL000374 [Levilactobacillus senmaizukei DSM 21775 = NBRC 103853]
MNNLVKLVWRRQRNTLWFVLAFTVLSIAVTTGMTVNNLESSEVLELVGDSIRRWEMYNGDYFNAYSNILIFVYWLVGLLVMNRDLKDNFNQFLFTSGYSRRRVYWTKFFVVQGFLLLTTVVGIAVQYGVAAVMLPSGIGFHLAWAGVLTSWLGGLLISWLFFAITWFAALIVGQTASLLVTVVGFTLSSFGILQIYLKLVSNRFWHLSEGQTLILGFGLMFLATVSLIVWGAWLFQRLSLEHNGEYLLFPKLRVPVYIVFVAYLTGLAAWNGLPITIAITFISTVLFGYGWLWRPKLGEKWHQYQRQHSARE